MLTVFSPVGALLALFFAVPVGVMIGIYGGEGASAYRQRHKRPKQF